MKILTSTLALFIVPFIGFAQVCIYVDSTATGLNNGTSWTNAYTLLDSAIHNATLGDTVKIAKGTYKPSSFPPACLNCTHAREYAYDIPQGVTVIGGYSSGGTSYNWQTNKVILDGDIGVQGDPTDNCYHIIIARNTFSEPISISGVTIKNAYADSAQSNNYSGSNISSSRGAGVFQVVSTLHMSNSIISDNYCDGGDGGGVLLTLNCGLICDSVQFINNVSANNNGGAVFADGDNTIINNSYFFGNIAQQGGAIRVVGTATMSGCVFEQNRQAILSSSGSKTTFNDCLFDDNFHNFSSDISSVAGDTLVIHNSVFQRTPANDSSAFLSVSSSTADVNNCIFRNNASTSTTFPVTLFDVNEGSQITNSLFDNMENGVRLSNSSGNPGVLFSNNTLVNIANQALIVSMDTPRVSNCIFWNNGQDIQISSSADEFVSNNITSYAGGSDNMDAYPQFKDTTNGDYSLLYGPAVNFGDNAFVPATNTSDLAGNDRIVGGTVDAGAYEFDFVFPCGDYATLTIDDSPIASATYKADGLIQSSGTVDEESLGPVIFQSESEIDLLANFGVLVGATFTATIVDPCN